MTALPPPAPSRATLPSRRERRRERRAARAADRQHDSDADTHVAGGPPVDTKPADGELPAARKPRTPLTVRWLFVCSAVVAGALVALLGGLPTLGASWRPAGLIAGTSVVVFAGLRGARLWPHVSQRAGIVGLAGMLLVPCAAAFGVRDAVLIDGSVVRAGSTEERAWQLSHQLRDDLYLVAAVDGLLSLPDVDARARAGAFEDADRQMTSMIDRLVGLDSVPAGFEVVVDHTKTAADAARRGVQRRVDGLREPSDAAARDVAALREQMAASVLAAGPILFDVAAHYGITLLPSADEGIE